MVGGTLSVDGKPLPPPWTMERLTAVFGRPSRPWSNGRASGQTSGIHTWDDAGVFCYEDTALGRVVAIAFAVGDDPRGEEWVYKPRRRFAGPLSVEGHAVDRLTPVTRVLEGTKGESVHSKLVPPATWLLEYEKANVYLHVDLAKESRVWQVSVSAEKALRGR
jgi:hypothetical protein